MKMNLLIGVDFFAEKPIANLYSYPFSVKKGDLKIRIFSYF